VLGTHLLPWCKDAAVLAHLCLPWFPLPGKIGKKEHLCGNSATARKRKMTINLAGTPYAPKSAAFAKK